MSLYQCASTLLGTAQSQCKVAPVLTPRSSECTQTHTQQPVSVNCAPFTGWLCTIRASGGMPVPSTWQYESSMACSRSNHGTSLAVEGLACVLSKGLCTTTIVPQLYVQYHSKRTRLLPNWACHGMLPPLSWLQPLLLQLKMPWCVGLVAR